MREVSIEEIEEVLGFKFSEDQKKIIHDKAEEIAIVAGRKWGKSQAVAAKLVYWATREPEGRTGITSKTENAAKESFMYVNQIIRLLKIKTVYESRLQTVIENNHSFECGTAGTTGFSWRPKSLTRLWTDEAAFVDDEVHDAMTPCL